MLLIEIEASLRTQKVLTAARYLEGYDMASMPTKPTWVIYKIDGGKRNNKCEM